MKAWLCSAFGPVEGLRLSPIDRPTMSPAQVRVRVRAVPLGFMDGLMVQGLYQLKPDLPYVPGAVGAGDVLEVGSEVVGVSVGDRVSFLNYYGALAEEAVSDARSVAVIPDGTSYEAAAAARLSYTPAYLALARRAQLRSGETLLVTGASGGVGHAAVRLGKVLGARVIGVVSGETTVPAVRNFGADEVIVLSRGRLRDQVKDLTGGRGADVILDVVGGDVFDECIRSVAFMGRLVVMGFASGRIPELRMNLPLLKNCSIIGVFLGDWVNRDPNGAQSLNSEITKLMAAGQLPAHIDLRFPFERAVDALLALRSRAAVGKIVVTVD